MERSSVTESGDHFCADVCAPRRGIVYGISSQNSRCAELGLFHVSLNTELVDVAERALKLPPEDESQGDIRIEGDEFVVSFH